MTVFNKSEFEKLIRLLEGPGDVKIYGRRRALILHALYKASDIERPALAITAGLTFGQRLIFGMVEDSGAASCSEETAGQDVNVLRNLGLVDVEAVDGILTLTLTQLGKEVSLEQSR